MSKTYSIMEFSGSSQEVLETATDRRLAVDIARVRSMDTSSDSIVAVVDDDTDEAIGEGVFVKGKLIQHGLVRSFVFGLSRMV